MWLLELREQSRFDFHIFEKNIKKTHKLRTQRKKEAAKKVLEDKKHIVKHIPVLTCM